MYVYVYKTAKKLTSFFNDPPKNLFFFLRYCMIQQYQLTLPNVVIHYDYHYNYMIDKGSEPLTLFDLLCLQEA